MKNYCVVDKEKIVPIIVWCLVSGVWCLVSGVWCLAALRLLLLVVIFPGLRRGGFFINTLPESRVLLNTPISVLIPHLAIFYKGKIAAFL